MDEHVRVRMYNVGFGDCFLLEFPSPDVRPFRVLIDCGAHTSGYPAKGWKPKDVVRQIIADIGGNSDPRIDIVVATHRHQDHVSGFESDNWANVTVGQVWMPWTEKLNDPEATRIRERQSRLALGLRQALTQRREFDAGEPPPSFDLAVNSLTNDKAMGNLHNGFRGRPQRRFLSAGDPGTFIELNDCPGLRIHVLGPSRKEATIRDMDPPGGQSYMSFADSTAPAVGHRPFGRQFTFDEGSFALQWPNLSLSQDVRSAARRMVTDDDFAVAVSLDKAVNGTSLMLAFEFGDAMLLFPGDAQWGTWREVLDNPEHRELIARTTFLKVGHHGSHNATPVELFDRVLAGRSIWGAAVSVHPVGNWPEIPKHELMDQLEHSATHVRRSDQPGSSQPGVAVRSGIGIDFEVPISEVRSAN